MSHTYLKDFPMLPYDLWVWRPWPTIRSTISGWILLIFRYFFIIFETKSLPTYNNENTSIQMRGQRQAARSNFDVNLKRYVTNVLKWRPQVSVLMAHVSCGLWICLGLDRVPKIWAKVRYRFHENFFIAIKINLSIFTKISWIFTT